MLAVRFHGPLDVRAEQVEAVTPTAGQALIRVAYGGVCGSDLHIYREGMFVEHIPEIMGHEFVGRIVSAPAGSGFAPGDAVTGDPRVPCGQCVACGDGHANRCEKLGFIGEVRPGGFAEYLALEPELLIKLPADADLRQAALSEPLAVALHACRRMQAQPHEQALIVGAGPIGLLIAYLLKHEYHLRRVAVADVDSYRQSLATAAGADAVGPDLAAYAPASDIIVDAAGSERALALLLEQAKHGSRLHISAIYEHVPLCDLNLPVSKEMTIFGNNNYDRADLEDAAALAASGRYDLSWLISSVLPASQAAEGFARLAGPSKRDMKILLDFGG